MWDNWWFNFVPGVFVAWSALSGLIVASWIYHSHWNCTFWLFQCSKNPRCDGILFWLEYLSIAFILWFFSLLFPDRLNPSHCFLIECFPSSNQSRQKSPVHILQTRPYTLRPHRLWYSQHSPWYRDQLSLTFRALVFWYLLGRDFLMNCQTQIHQQHLEQQSRVSSTWSSLYSLRLLV